LSNMDYAKMLNKAVMGNKFVDEDTNEYLYASLSQPPIKIIDKNGSNDELDYTVECPHCHSHVNYGKETYMIGGHIYCGRGNCREEVTNAYLKSKEENNEYNK